MQMMQVTDSYAVIVADHKGTTVKGTGSHPGSASGRRGFWLMARRSRAARAVSLGYFVNSERTDRLIAVVD